MKTGTTAIATIGILSLGAAFAAAPAARTASGTAGFCSHWAARRDLTGNARSQYVSRCRIGVSRAYLAFNQNRNAKDADLGG